MKRCNFLRDLALAAVATLVACGFTAACQSGGHPDDQQAVYKALTSHDLASVVVDQNRDKGVIKLSGIVGSADRKNSAQQLAQQAAPGYTIDNQVQVDQAGLLNAPNTSDQSAMAQSTPAKPHQKQR